MSIRPESGKGEGDVLTEDVAEGADDVTLGIDEEEDVAAEL
jgi:hypothetical protein